MKNKLTEKQAWEIFAQTGDIRAYLLYKAANSRNYNTEASQEPDGYELLLKKISCPHGSSRKKRRRKNNCLRRRKE